MAAESSKQKFMLSLISCVAAIGGLLFGYDTGVIAGALLYIGNDYALSTFQTGLIVSIVSLGAVLGAITAGTLSDAIGRKKVVLFSSLLFIVSALGLALSSSVNSMIIWRLFVGIAIGVSSAVSPLYIAELSPKFIRGALVTLNQLAITIGILSSYLIGLLFVESHSWRTMFAIAAIPALIQLIIMSFFPESPRYLSQKGKNKEALSILKRFRGSDQDAELELSHIEKMINTTKAHWSEVFSKKIRPALLVGIGVTVIQQLTGINTIFYFAPTIFEFAGFGSDRSALLAAAGLGTINVLTTFVAIYLLDKVGRKPLLYFGLGGMVLSLFVLGISFYYVGHGSIAGVICVITLMVYVASFAYSLGPIGWLLNSEIYPLHIRGRAMGLATCANWIANFIITSTFLNLIKVLGDSRTFWLYACIGVVGLLFIWKKVPETSEKSLEEIEDFWKK